MTANENKRYKVTVKKDKEFNEDIVYITDLDKEKEQKNINPVDDTKESKKEKFKKIKDFIIFAGLGLIGAFVWMKMQDDGGHWGDY